MSVTVRVPAKVNVQLAVGGLRPDGFHDLANVFLAVAIHDEVTVTPSDSLRITVSGPNAHQVPVDGSNLVAKAARLLAERFGTDPRVHLHIAKDIPVAGGMAGGSADCAAALVACEALWGTGATREDLHTLAAELGSDVPFPLLGGAALGRGRGELLEPLETGGTFHWVFAMAQGGLSTPAVYRECDRLREERGLGSSTADIPAPQPSPELLEALRLGDPAALGARIAASNDLQEAALSLRPALAETLRTGTEAGALAALVSGSGPTCAFLAKDPESANDVAEALLASNTCRSVRVTHGPVGGAAVVGG
ncbi:4-(cytidine 5'-diphospho)-2-C-methyl-D-erythritol kinase [Wenjunlia tyrosinilytica]|uniref:4-diphosphocytidyl-2-C-methyl-D-erythritol kinase n=1 Tax=Wenjunlia tyrosinilytica TaxID=1544741 RepID=A0A917ZNX2_9ACTN|nr:4-(cytidine 5'-diphospho)-2-C-methyl-D-erythritol kinase [Wenjunlia tyrosinilytica]GGO88422.1 4-diphosphocytidyl-2-C-methyl-D-erythritol kinase [Wenjunlia tyrosinilytica]